MRHLLRTRALAIIIMAGFTAALVLGQWFAVPRPLVLPLVVAYLLFNFGYGVMVAKSGHLTMGSRLSAAAVLLNIVAMVLRDFSAVWTALSAAAVLVAFGAAYMLFKESRAVAA